MLLYTSYFYSRTNTFWILDSFWDPKLIVQNLIDQTKDDKPWKEVIYTQKKKAYIVEKRRLRGNFSEKLELADFPFDAQYLNVYITSEYPQSQLEILEDNEEISLLNSACFVDEQEWALCDFVTMRQKATRKDFSQREAGNISGYKCRMLCGTEMEVFCMEYGAYNGNTYNK